MHDLGISRINKVLASTRVTLGEVDFCQAWESGRVMTEAQVLDFAMQVLGGEAGGSILAVGL